MSKTEIGTTAGLVPPLDGSVFPVTRRWTYCDHASVGPLPLPARDAMVAALDAQMADGCNGILDVEAKKESVRAEVARAINAAPHEIAFMRSTSDGALLAANGIDWNEGDEIITCDDEFGANAHPWLNLRDRGVTTRLVRAPEERLSIDALERLAGKRTRLVSVSYVGYLDGYRNDIPTIGAWCRTRDILFAVDAIQGFGCLPFDATGWNVDFCYFGTAKWLLSPQGLSIVFVRAPLVDRLRPALCSWRSVREPMNFRDYAQEFLDGAPRFDAATMNYPALLAFRESLALLATAGFGAIERHVLALGARLAAGAQRLGVRVLGDQDPKHRSGITLLDRGSRSVEDLKARAGRASVQMTIRDSGIRVAPHGYNTEADIDRVLSLL